MMFRILNMSESRAAIEEGWTRSAASRHQPVHDQRYSTQRQVPVEVVHSGPKVSRRRSRMEAATRS